MCLAISYLGLLDLSGVLPRRETDIIAMRKLRHTASTTIQGEFGMTQHKEYNYVT